ncbi:MAG: hypothetical protein KatS3mg057_3064 [Herpetosiphonaceae bacterium]|nr:MAG: hypothetical protein KatS3mg057_3064 [Herpetosiphonaceae bacterium]
MKILLHWFAATTRALFVLTALVHILASQVAASSTEGFPRPAISGNITPAVPAAASMTDSADLRVSSSDSTDPVIAGSELLYLHSHSQEYRFLNGYRCNTG